MADKRRPGGGSNLPARANNDDDASESRVEIEYREYQGPLPPPALLTGYEKVLPGLAERIVTRMERETEFRHEIARQHMQNSRDLQNQNFELEKNWQVYFGRGQILGFILALIVLGIGAFMAYLGNAGAGAGVIISGIVAAGSVFVYKVHTGKKPADNTND